LNYGKKAKSKWPRKSIVVISQSPNLHMLLKELVRGYGWVIEESTESVDRAIELVKTGVAYMIIVDDSVEEPAAGTLRVLNSDLITCATPVLSFLLDLHETERDAIRHLGHNEIVEKPLTPSKFIPGFRKLIATWESQQYVALRMAIHQFMRFGPEMGHNTMKKLIGIDSILPLVAQNMSINYRNRGNLVDAEKILLHALKKSPKNLGLLLALGELYMHCAMPKMAHRLFNSARANFGDSMAILPDMIQSALSLEKFEEATAGLLNLKKRQFQEKNTADFLTRVLLANGRENEAEKQLAAKKNQFRKIKASWVEAAEDPSIISAS